MKNKILCITAVILMAVFTITGCGSKQAEVPAVNSGIVETYEGTVSYLGPEGTYTQEATRQFFGTEGDYRPQKTVQDAVWQLLAAITKSDLQIVSIHDRPEKTTLGRYVYLIECEEGSYNEYEKISSLPEFEFRYFGTFPVR